MKVNIQSQASLDAPSRGTTITRIAKVPYLNSAPFFRDLPLADGYRLTDASPRDLGQQAAAGEVAAGLLAVADYFRVEDRFERLGPFGIAVRGRARSVLLFSRRPIRQLDGAVIAVTEETSTSILLLRLILEQRYHIIPAGYERRLHPERRQQRASVTRDRRQDAEADALLLIGDEALRFQHTNAQYPYEIDLGFEWWLWQHVPCVFAVWAVKKDLRAEQKKSIEVALTKALAHNVGQFEQIAQTASSSLGLSVEVLQAYLSGFIYRLSQPEEAGIVRFRELLDAHHLL